MLNAEVAGTGSVLVFLHGYGENLTIWHKITSSLTAKYKVVLIDLPGFGKSPPIDADFTIEDIALTIESHLSSVLQINQFIVFGHSLGGYVSLALKELFQEKVRGLGLINSTSFADSEEKKHFRAKTSAFIVKNGTKQFLETFVPNLFTLQNQKKMRAIIQEVLEMGRNLPTSVLLTYMAAMSKRKDLSHLLVHSNNILFVGGLHDQLISQDDQKSQLSMLQKELNSCILEDVAHMAMIESPRRIEKLILSFCKKLKID